VTRDPRRIIALSGFVLGLTALILQFLISMGAWLDQGDTILPSLVRFFSYFTILTNSVIVLIYLGAVTRGQRWLAPFRSPRTRATAAACITLVMGFYYFFLAGTWQPEGLFLIADVALHYATPLLFLIWFAGFNRTGTLKWEQALPMLTAPFFYLAWVLLRGAVTGEYPYPVLNASQLGYTSVAINVLMLLIVLVTLSLTAIAVDRSLLSKKSN